MSFDTVTKRYSRECKYCAQVLPGMDGAVQGRALEHDGKLWLFCSIEHKAQWDLGRKTLRRLEEAPW
jgi:hypothetical protein